jgi:MFS superfamily sulfate permease-like transporter
MFGFFGTVTLISSVIFVCGFGIAMTEQWEWRGKWHERITIGCALIAVIFSTILNIIS